MTLGLFRYFTPRQRLIEPWPSHFGGSSGRSVTLHISLGIGWHLDVACVVVEFVSKKFDVPKGTKTGGLFPKSLY